MGQSYNTHILLRTTGHKIGWDRTTILTICYGQLDTRYDGTEIQYSQSATDHWTQDRMGQSYNTHNLLQTTGHEIGWDRATILTICYGQLDTRWDGTGLQYSQSATDHWTQDRMGQSYNITICYGQLDTRWDGTEIQYSHSATDNWTQDMMEQNYNTHNLLRNTGHKIGCDRATILTTTRYKRQLDLTEHSH